MKNNTKALTLAAYISMLFLGVATTIVGAAARRAADGGKTFRAELLAEPVLREHLSPEEIDAALDPTGYLGSGGEFIDRALALYHKEAPS